MSTAINATNSKGLKIIDCHFDGFDTDIELDNVEDFTSKGNIFSKDNPKQLLMQLADLINKSCLPNNEKRQLFQEIIGFLSTHNGGNARKDSITQKIVAYVGDKAVDYFVQLMAAVSGGMILRVS